MLAVTRKICIMNPSLLAKNSSHPALAIRTWSRQVDGKCVMWIYCESLQSRI